VSQAPSVTEDDVDSLIVGEEYHVFPGTTVTVCCLTLQNGYSVIGSSACVSFSRFDYQVGRTAARADARDKIWALEGYLLRQRIHDKKVA